METIFTHYVASSRPLINAGGMLTYQKGNRRTDTAYNYLNLGRYQIRSDLQPPVFKIIGETEKNHFHSPEGSFYLPGDETGPFFEEIFTKLKKKENKLLYIYLHGFGNGVKKEINKQVYPFHKYYYDELNPGSPVGSLLFLSWPSQGFFQYKNGEIFDVSRMGISLSVFFLKMFHFINDRENPLFSDWKPKIVFHSQSMGCRIVQAMINRLNVLESENKIGKNTLHSFFDRLILTGADLGEHALKDREATHIHDIAKRVTLFHNKKDLALWISTNIFGSPDRLGGDGKPDIKKFPKNVDLVALSDAGLVGHNYFQRKPKLIKRILGMLDNTHFDGETIVEGKNRRVYYDCDEDRVIEAEWIG